MTDHNRFEMLAAASLDFTLTDVEATELRRHLVECGACARFAAAMRADASRAASRPRERSPERVRAAIAARVLRREPTVTTRRLIGITAAFAIVIAALVATALVPRPEQGPGQLSRLSFSPLPNLTPFGYGMVGDLLPFRSRLFAAGSTQAGGTSSGVLWSSRDGLAWVRTSASDPFNGAILIRLASDGRVLVALGQDCPAQGQTGCGASHVWRSTDGQAWTTVSGDFGRCCGARVGVRYLALAAGRTGFTGGGGAYSLDSSGASLIGAAIASSADGFAWRFSRASDPALVRGSIGGIADGPAGLVAVGATKPEASSQDPYPGPSIWTSSDGTDWVRSLLPTPSQDAVFLNDVVASTTLYVAAGRDASSAATWVSSDGRTWRESPMSKALADATIHRVVWFGNTFVAVGQSRFGDVGDGIAWVSTDGLSWSRLDTGSLFTGAPILAVGEINSRLVLFGTNQSGAVVGAISGTP